MSHKPRKDLEGMCDVPADVAPIRPTAEEIARKRKKAHGEPFTLKDCPKCKKPGIPPGYAYEFCLRCGYEAPKKK
jgi:hypothetical protein